MRLTLAHGADPAIGTFAGTTPLMAAAGINWVFNQTFDEGPEALLEAVALCFELGARRQRDEHDGPYCDSRGRKPRLERHHRVPRGAAAPMLDTPDPHGRTPSVWAEGVFLATHPPQRKPETIELLARLLRTAPP